MKPHQWSAVVHLAKQAGNDIMLELEKGKDLKVEHKADGSIVTQADIRANKRIVEGLNALTPEIPILSEEMDAATQQEIMKQPLYWCVDPLDGTNTAHKYAMGQKDHTGFGVLIGLVKNGEPVFGVAHYPAAEDGKGVTYNTNWTGTAAFCTRGNGETKPITVRNYSRGPMQIAAGFRGAAPEMIAGRPAHNRPDVGGSRILRAAEGAVHVGYMGNDGPISFGFWDLAAPAAILRAAGGDLVTLPGTFGDHQQRGALAKSESLRFDGTHYAEHIGPGKPFLPACMAAGLGTLKFLGMALQETLRIR